MNTDPDASEMYTKLPPPAPEAPITPALIGHCAIGDSLVTLGGAAVEYEPNPIVGGN